MKIPPSLAAAALVMALTAPAFSQDKGTSSSPDSASKAEKTRSGTKNSAPASAAVPAGNPSDTGNATQQSRTKGH